jgi:hypothetical protein
LRRAQEERKARLGDERTGAVNLSFDGSQMHFTFGIPRGQNGNDGMAGPQGNDGPPGKVTNAQFTDAITTSSSNTNSVNVLGLSAGGNYDEWLMQQVITKLDELIMALRR